MAGRTDDSFLCDNGCGRGSNGVDLESKIFGRTSGHFFGKCNYKCTIGIYTWLFAVVFLPGLAVDFRIFSGDVYLAVGGMDLFKASGILEASMVVFVGCKFVFVRNRDFDFLKDGRKK